VSLTWDVIGATSVSIDPGYGAVTAKSQMVSPGATTTYTITATNAIGSVTSVPVTITVTQTGVPIITSFTATPTSINTGGSSTLSWNITGATSATINGVAVSSFTTGTQAVNPAASTIYTLIATNATGNATTTATVTVSALTPPVITSFTAIPEHVSPGVEAKLYWSIPSSSIVDSISISGISPPYSQFGHIVMPLVTTTYTLTVTNGAGSVTAIATVTVP
jgi:hypothetical protein